MSPALRPLYWPSYCACNRTGSAGKGFAAIFDGLNEELLRLGLLSPGMCVDSSLVKANVSNYGLAPSEMTLEEFREQAIELNGLFMIEQAGVDGDGVEH